MRARRLLVLAVVVSLVAACRGDDEQGLSTTTTTRSVAAHPVAATELVVGDCITGVVVGAAERARVDSLRVIGCDRPHELEVFANFDLAPADFDVADGSFPGQQRIVVASDRGCDDRFQELGEIIDSIGLIAVWPTATSWAQGDRTVACAAYAADGGSFGGNDLVSE